MLAAPVAEAVDERGADAAEGHERRREIGGGARHPRWGIAGVAGERHQAAHALGDGVVAGLLRERPRLAEARDRRVDDGGVGGADGCIAQAEPLGHAGQEVLDEHVGLAGQLEGQARALGLLEVHRDAALVAVHGGEGSAHPAGSPQRAQVVAPSRPLQLDHVGAEIAQQRRAVRPRDNTREVEDADPVEHGGPPIVPRRSPAVKAAVHTEIPGRTSAMSRGPECREGP